MTSLRLLHTAVTLWFFTLWFYRMFLLCRLKQLHENPPRPLVGRSRDRSSLLGLIPTILHCYLKPVTLLRSLTQKGSHWLRLSGSPVESVAHCSSWLFYKCVFGVGRQETSETKESFVAFSHPLIGNQTHVSSRQREDGERTGGEEEQPRK